MEAGNIRCRPGPSAMVVKDVVGPSARHERIYVSVTLRNVAVMSHRNVASIMRIRTPSNNC